MLLCMLAGIILFAGNLIGSVLLAMLIVISWPFHAVVWLLDLLCAGVAWFVNLCEEPFL